MASLQTVVRWEVALFLSGLCAIILVQLLTGRINTRWLLYGRNNGQRYFSPERVQLLVLTLGGAVYYLFALLQMPDPGSLPAVPNAWLGLLGGSNSLYLLGKAYTMLGRK